MKKKDRAKMKAEATKIAKNGGCYLHFQMDGDGDCWISIAGHGLQVIFGLTELINKTAEQAGAKTETIMDLLNTMSYDVNHLDLIKALRGNDDES